MNRSSMFSDPSKGDEEFVITTWINEFDLQLKFYDIISILKDQGLPKNGNTAQFEYFNVADETEQIRVIKNDRKRIKSLACLIPIISKENLNEMLEVNKTRARTKKPAGDLRPNPYIDTVIP